MHPSRRPPPIEPTAFDAVIIGTGLPESILSASLAVAGRSVLHVDPSGAYGSHWASLRLDEFDRWVRRGGAEVDFLGCDDETEGFRDEDEEEGAGIVAHENSSMAETSEPVFESVSEPEEGNRDRLDSTRTEFRETGDSVRAVEPASEPHAESVSEPVTEINSEPGKGQNDCTDTDGTEAGESAEVKKFKEKEKEAKLKFNELQCDISEGRVRALEVPLNQAHGSEIYGDFVVHGSVLAACSKADENKFFNIDLNGPRVSYCAGSMVRFLVRTGCHNYLEFKSVGGSSLMLWRETGGEKSERKRERDEKQERKSENMLVKRVPKDGEEEDSFHKPVSKLVTGLNSSEPVVGSEYELCSVPASRADVFQDKSLSLVEKRVLMRFLKIVMEVAQRDEERERGEGEGIDEGASGKAIGNASAETFSDLLQSYKLPIKVQKYLLYAVALLPHEQGEWERQGGRKEGGKLSRLSEGERRGEGECGTWKEREEASLKFPSVQVGAEEGMRRLSLYFRSVSKFASSATPRNPAGPFLYPLYGNGELTQAFCRLAAVKGATYVLRRPVKFVLVERTSMLEKKEGESGRREKEGEREGEGGADAPPSLSPLSLVNEARENDTSRHHDGSLGLFKNAKTNAKGAFVCRGIFTSSPEQVIASPLIIVGPTFFPKLEIQKFPQLETIQNPEFFPKLEAEADVGRSVAPMGSCHVARCVCITDRSLKGELENVMVTIPPEVVRSATGSYFSSRARSHLRDSEVDAPATNADASFSHWSNLLAVNAPAICLLQVDSSLCVAPNGKFLTYASCKIPFSLYEASKKFLPSSPRSSVSELLLLPSLSLLFSFPLNDKTKSDSCHVSILQNNQTTHEPRKERGKEEGEVEVVERAGENAQLSEREVRGGKETAREERRAEADESEKDDQEKEAENNETTPGNSKSKVTERPRVLYGVFYTQRERVGVTREEGGGEERGEEGGEEKEELKVERSEGGAAIEGKEGRRYEKRDGDDKVDGVSGLFACGLPYNDVDYLKMLEEVEQMFRECAPDCTFFLDEKEQRGGDEEEEEDV